MTFATGIITITAFQTDSNYIVLSMIMFAATVFIQFKSINRNAVYLNIAHTFIFSTNKHMQLHNIQK